MRERRVSAVLDGLLESSSTPVEQRDVSGLKLIVFSDHHRGQRDGADDFRRCRAAYHVALSHYLANGFELFLLGDVEELWECRPEQVFDAYADTLELELQFARRGRYRRFAGNHDDHWLFGRSFQRLLEHRLRVDTGELPQECLRVHEGLVLEIVADDIVGRLLFVHGHHGATLSDDLASMSRILVRLLWRPLQRLTGWSTSSLSSDFSLRTRHEMAMSRWVDHKPGLLLVAGHTHHPVFGGISHEVQLRHELEQLEAERRRVVDPPLAGELDRRLTAKRAELRYRLAESEGQTLQAEASSGAYFNIGCCCYRSGSITGLELDGGALRLIRWYQEGAEVRRQELRTVDLMSLLRSRSGRPQAPGPAG